MNTDLKPFEINVSGEILKDLETRLKTTRWSEDLNNEDSYYGISTAYLKDIVHHWINSYDWEAAQKELNSFNQHKIEIDGQAIHFIYEKGKGPNPTPIILSHGWPWTYWHWSKVIRQLTDPASYGRDPEQSFDVIVPSLPGFGFSTPVKDGEMNFSKMAELWHKLMTETLGYKKYAASGSDYGMLVTAQLGHKYAEELIGIHLGQEMPLTIFQSERPWDLTEGQMIPKEASPELREGIIKFQRTYASHVAVHMLDAQTITHGLNDSPVGMLAWILQRWKKWSDINGNFEDVFSKDDIITFAMIYWVNQAIGSSIRVYSNANRYPWKPSHNRTPIVEAPAGFTFLTGDAYPPLGTEENRVGIFENGPMASQFNTIYAKAFKKGGHFGPWENPEAFIEGITDTFRLLKN
ncbi:epoxide hydrolase family protein [Chryseobacterium sp. LAM-KRS1]|uniref:epoxide hydrolase family protein n=1 Tax=Chryseobacterium sp. LAM-KRS1 TaxID=2715754 RepID=UPI00155677B0|nr:epoxide hydrolase family protein [Chryseobacterium sp. LAM-KRS1]